MKLSRIFATAAFLAFVVAAPGTPQASHVSQPEPRLDDAPPLPPKQQQDAILKADHEKDLKDAAQLVELAEQLKMELEKNDRRVLSVASLKKTEEIEKLAKHIRSRLVH